MRNKNSIKALKEICVELQGGKKVEWEFEATLIIDSNYGADADGNRGMEMSWIDDVAPVGNLSKELRHDIGGAPLTNEEIIEAISLLEEAATDADYDFIDDSWADVEYDALRDDGLI